MTIYLIVWSIIAALSVVVGVAILSDANNQADRNFAKAAPFIGIVGGAVWPLAIVVAVLGGLVYGGWHTARAIKHRGFDY